MYFNPGVAEARNYISAAVNEIVENYNIDGIHMDDYFYPYPSTQAFDDASQYDAYITGGGNLSLADWRRSNVNAVVSGLYETIKTSKPYVKFGISPFCIWKNKASDATGSATNGLESYSSIYADTRTWIQQGRVDYIAPQIYWHFGYSAAAYDVLVDWWMNEVEQYAEVHDMPPLSFSDVSESHWAYSYLQQLVAGKVLQGYADGSFKPDQAMTRAEYMTVLYRLAGVDTTAPAAYFSDVVENGWYSNAINYLVYEVT